MSKQKRQFDNDRIPFREKPQPKKLPPACQEFLDSKGKFPFIGAHKMCILTRLAREGREEELKSELGAIYLKMRLEGSRHKGLTDLGKIALF